MTRSVYGAGVAQEKHPPAPRHIARIHAALTAREEAEAELRAAVVAALKGGGSIREVAIIAGMSTNTIQRWGREGGWPTAAQRLEWERPRREREELYERLGITEAMRLLDEHRDRERRGEA